MLLRLIKTRPMNTGCHCEVWIINHLTGDTKLGNVFVLYEHLPLEIIYPVTVRLSGLYIHGQHCGWVWENPLLEALVNSYLMEIQASREEIYLDICDPEPYLPRYPHTDYHPDDYPIIIYVGDKIEEM